jgi:MFS family permease
VPGEPPTRWATSNVALLSAVFCTNASAIGQVTVVGKVVYDLTGSKLDLGLLGLAQFAPALVLVLLTGAVADRVDRRRVLAIGSVAEAAIALVLAWYAGTRPTSIVPIVGLVLVFGVAQSFVAPAERSLPADIAGADEVPRLTARTTAAGQAGIVAGPVIGGFLFVVDVRLPFVAFATLLVAGAASALFVRMSGVPRALSPAAGLLADAALEAATEPATGHGPVPVRSSVHDAMEGLRFVRSQPVIFGAISLDLFAVLFGGAVALLPAIAKDRLGVGAVGLGWLQASAGLGAGAMTLLLAVRPLGRRLGRTLLSVVALFGLFTVVLALTRDYAVAFLAIFALSAADAISVFIRATLVPLATPEDKRGRVLAVENVFIGASNELGGFESGVTGQLLGTSGSVLLGGVATLAVAVLWWAVFPALRDVDGFPDPP